MLRCVSKINPVRLQFVCCLQRLLSLGWAAPAIWSNMQCHIGPRWGPQRHGHKFRRACVRRGLANCQTYVLKRSLDARPAHIIYLITLFQTLSYPGSPPLHSPPSHIWRKRTNCQDRQSDRWSSLSLSLGSWSSQSIAVHTKRRCCRCRCWSTLMPD